MGESGPVGPKGYKGAKGFQGSIGLAGTKGEKVIHDSCEVAPVLFTFIKGRHWANRSTWSYWTSGASGQLLQELSLVEISPCTCVGLAWI